MFKKHVVGRQGQKKIPDGEVSTEFRNNINNKTPVKNNNNLDSNNINK
jgi:hypothetical protein